MSERRLDDPDLPVADIMRYWPMTVAIFIAHRMLCVGCMIGPFCTLHEACLEFGIELETMLSELRTAANEGTWC